MGFYHKQLSQPVVLPRQADRLVERRFRPGFDGMTAEELFRQSAFCKDLNRRKSIGFPILAID